VVSLRITGRRLERLRARGGQFFLWRFLDGPGAWEAHPFSLSESPDGRSLRITVKELGDFTGRMGDLEPGTRVAAEGPFGVFTADARRTEKVLLIAGGIGITPIRALVDELRGDVVVVHRVLSVEDAVLRDELEALARDGRISLHVVAGDHATDDGRNLLSAEHLRALVPDVVERDVFLCGPPAMTEVIERVLRAARVPRRHVHVERFAL
jgi:predicted ferric reductase